MLQGTRALTPESQRIVASKMIRIQMLICRFLSRPSKLSELKAARKWTNLPPKLKVTSMNKI